MAIDPGLLQILVCPACRERVHPVPDDGLECGRCGRVYPIREGVPVMLLEEASKPRGNPVE
jgi:uncharacterized protein YbaR (Trm112 family)